MKKRILVVDDDNMNLARTRIILGKEYDVLLADSGVQALAKVQNEAVDMVLLDIDMPGMNGIETFERMKKNAVAVPVIFLTALGTTENKVKGLKMGADDYLTKPFEIVELLARVEAVLRRYHKTETLLTVFDVVIDTASRSVTQNGEPVLLTMKEFELLLLLARNRNIALYRETIYENIWGGEYMGQSRTVDLHIQRLKKKLNWDNEIAAVYKVGYRLEGEEKITK